MNTLIKYLISLVFLVSFSMYAQDFQGVATYKSKRKIDVKLDSSQMQSEMAQKMIEMMKKQFEKTHILTFSKEESIYKEDEQLGRPQPAGVQIVMVNTGGSDVLYKNSKEDRKTNQIESFSKLFLIKDKLTKHDWKLSGETKFIGDYKCFKATFMREVPDVESRVSVNGDNEPDEEELNKEPKMKEVEVVAWYTPQIPVNNGPGNYHGLPGLILEVNDGTTTTICSKVVLNPEKKVSIVEPKKGKLITQEKYDALMEKKVQEMNERHRHNNRNRDGESISINIGG